MLLVARSRLRHHRAQRNECPPEFFSTGWEFFLSDAQGSPGSPLPYNARASRQKRARKWSGVTEFHTAKPLWPARRVPNVELVKQC